MKGAFLFLGTGASAGIPVIGCSCAVCKSKSSFNHRLRPSGIIKVKDKVLLIDTGPDLRQQALLHRIDKIDGILLTHTHYDHIAGIDELRAFYLMTKQSIACLLSQDSLNDLKQRYDYLFKAVEDLSTLSAQLKFQLLESDAGIAEFEGIPISYCTYFQGKMKVVGYRIGEFAYISDIRKFDDSVFQMLKGVRHLVLSALRLEASPVHFSIDEAIAFVRRAGVEKTWITHISHRLDHEETERMLPPDIRMGYDGLEIEFGL